MNSIQIWFTPFVLHQLSPSKWYMRVQLGLPKLKPLGIPNGNGCNLVVATNASLRDPTFFDSQQLSSTKPPNFPDFGTNQSFRINFPWQQFHTKNSLSGMSWLAFPSKNWNFLPSFFRSWDYEILGIPGIVTAPPRTPRWTFTPRKVTPQHRWAAKSWAVFVLDNSKGLKLCEIQTPFFFILHRL